jgi:hypothetical protein
MDLEGVGHSLFESTTIPVLAMETGEDHKNFRYNRYTAEIRIGYLPNTTCSVWTDNHF